MLLVQSATPETITQFHDQLSNELPVIKGKWGFTFRIYKNNPYAIPLHLQEEVSVNTTTKYLHTLTPTYIPDSSIVLIDKKSVGVFPSVVAEEMATPSDILIPDEHLSGGATTGLDDLVDTFISSRLQSLWSQRQVIKGDGGQIYQLENGNLVIKTSNVTLHGNFRGLLIEIDLVDWDLNNKKDVQKEFERVCAQYNVPTGHLNCDVLSKKKFDKYGDLCLQYAENLNF